MKEKVIGVLGGMGPEATLALFKEIIEQTPVNREQDHIRVIIDSNPKIPSRPEAILGEGMSPVPMMVAGARSLERAGADFFIIPCVTAHYFLPRVTENVSIPVISILDVLVDYFNTVYPGIRNTGIFATSALLSTSLLQKTLSDHLINPIVPEKNEQDKVQNIITSIKLTSSNDGSRKRLRSELLSLTEQLLQRGAESICAACTEIPVLLKQVDMEVPFIDSIKILARAAINKAKNG